MELVYLFFSFESGCCQTAKDEVDHIPCRLALPFLIFVFVVRLLVVLVVSLCLVSFGGKASAVELSTVYCRMFVVRVIRALLF